MGDMYSIFRLLEAMEGEDKQAVFDFALSRMSAADEARKEVNAIKPRIKPALDWIVAYIESKLKFDASPQAIRRMILEAVDSRSDAILNTLPKLKSKKTRLALEQHESDRARLAMSLRKARSRRRKIATEIALCKSELAHSWKTVCDARGMPEIPLPIVTAADLGGESRKFAGVYFGWHGPKVVYVGESINIPQRLRSHENISPHWLVSYLEMEPAERFFAESFYIWLTRPPLNKEGGKTLTEGGHCGCFKNDAAFKEWKKEHFVYGWNRYTNIKRSNK
jgi:hypothetical protein